MPSKYQRIGKNYNLTRQADACILEKLRQHLKPETGGKYLDVGCGTGNYTIALSERGINLAGVDPSSLMLEKARGRTDRVVWKIGRAEKIPFPDDSFGGVLATLTIHHWTSLEKGFREINRVLKRNGRVVIFTSTAGQMQDYWLNVYFPKMLAASIGQMPALSTITNTLRNSGFEITETEKYFVCKDLADLFLYAGKHRPEMYLDERIRGGISSFSDLAEASEIRAGLKKLEADITSGSIEEIIAGAESDAGDYLFITAKKI